MKNQKLMLVNFLKDQKTPASLDAIMEFVEKNSGIPRSTIRARLSELRKKGLKVEDKLIKAENNGVGWILKEGIAVEEKTVKPKKAKVKEIKN